MPAALGAVSATQVDFDNSIDLNMPSLVGVPTDGSAMIVAVLRQSLGPVVSTGGVFTMKRTAADGLVSVAYKRVAGGEAATYNFTCAALNIFSDARAFVVTGIPTAGDPFDVVPVQNFVNGASSTALSLTTLTANDLLVFADAHNNVSRTTSSAPSGMTARGGDPNTLHLFDQVQAAIGGTGSKIHTTTAASDHYASLMAIKSALPNAGTFTGSYDFTGTGFTGEAGAGEGSFAGAYDFTGSGFTGEAGPGEGTFTGGYDFAGAFTGVAPPDPFGDGRWTPGGRDRFTARRTPKNRRRSR